MHPAGALVLSHTLHGFCSALYLFIFMNSKTGSTFIPTKVGLVGLKRPISGSSSSRIRLYTREAPVDSSWVVLFCYLEVRCLSLAFLLDFFGKARAQIRERVKVLCVMREP